MEHCSYRQKSLRPRWVHLKYDGCWEQFIKMRRKESFFHTQEIIDEMEMAVDWPVYLLLWSSQKQPCWIHKGISQFTNDKENNKRWWCKNSLTTKSKTCKVKMGPAIPTTPPHCDQQCCAWKRSLNAFIFWANVNWTYCITAWWTLLWNRSFWCLWTERSLSLTAFYRRVICFINTQNDRKNKICLTGCHGYLRYLLSIL